MVVADDRLIAADSSKIRYFLFLDYSLNSDYAVVELTDNITSLGSFPYSNLQVSTFTWKIETIYQFNAAQIIRISKPNVISVYF